MNKNSNNNSNSNSYNNNSNSNGNGNCNCNCNNNYYYNNNYCYNKSNSNSNSNDNGSGSGSGNSNSNSNGNGNGNGNSYGNRNGKINFNNIINKLGKLLMSPANNYVTLRIAVGIYLLIVSVIISLPEFIDTAVLMTAYVITGFDIISRAIKNISKGQIFDESFLMGIATIGAVILGEIPEAVAVMLFYQTGELIQETVVNRSTRAITSLYSIRPDFATVISEIEGKIVEKKVPPSDVIPGDLIIVRPGERIPLDGIITDGFSTIDNSALTGESIPIYVEKGNTVLSGSINLDGVLWIKVSKEYSQSTINKIIEHIKTASSRKAPSEKFITKFARYYTPAVVLTALALALFPPVFIPGEIFSVWAKRALVFLVVSCPCALVISIPLSFAGGIGGASKNGILIKGGKFLDALVNIDTIVFDKTGTLTEGALNVEKIIGTKGFPEDDVLEYAAIAESYSNHPIALSICKAYRKLSGISNINESAGRHSISNYRETPGKGISLVIDGHEVFLGSYQYITGEFRQLSADKAVRQLSADEAVRQLSANVNGRQLSADEAVRQLSANANGKQLSADEAGKLSDYEYSNKGASKVVHLIIDSIYAGCLILSDRIKNDSYKAVKALRKAGVNKLAMLTGDSSFIGQKTGQSLKLDYIRTGLLPEDKVVELEKIIKEKKTQGAVLYAGDGINDAPVIARADIGVAMGGTGSEIALETADIVIMNDELSKIPAAINIARKTRRIVTQNIFLAIFVKVLVLLLGAGGIASLWEAVFADTGVAVLAVLNAMRALNFRQPIQE